MDSDEVMASPTELRRARKLVSDAVFGAMRDAFGDDAFVAAFRHREPFDVQRVRAAEKIEARFGIAAIASARPLYHDPTRRPLADVLACIRLGTTLDRAGTRIAQNAQRTLRSDAEMRALFADRLPWVERTSEIASMPSNTSATTGPAVIVSSSPL